MRSSVSEIIARIEACNDANELSIWLWNYKEDIKAEGCSSEACYYLEEIRQTMVCQQETLLEMKKAYLIDAEKAIDE